MQNNSSDGRNSLDFFQLYRTFLEINSVSSFIHGRNRSLIKNFYSVYYFEAMSKKNSKDKNIQDIQDKLNQAKELLKTNFREYVSQRKEYRIKIWKNLKEEQHSKYLCIIENPNISEAFLELTYAIEQYEKWRSKLNDEQIKIIYEKNLKDRQVYYTDNDNGFSDFNKDLLGKINVKALKNNKILKQTLIEFHNGISHLVSIYYGKIENDKNKSRAINHFKRGALDSYKAIIKDFYYIRSCDKKIVYEPLKYIKQIRKEEYSNIGK